MWRKNFCIHLFWQMMKENNAKVTSKIVFFAMVKLIKK